MTRTQRIAAGAALLAAVLAAAAFAWRGGDVYPRLTLREPHLALPDPNQALHPGADGRPLLLVVIENTPQARPQSGLADACLVYALPTEARITRFLAAYCGHRPAEIGPVRSARRYMLELAGDLDAILVHAGSSAEALTQIRRERLRVINQFWRPGPFWRDARRQMPHNLYTGYDRLLADLEHAPMVTTYRPLPYAFSYEATAPESSTPAEVVSLDYGPLYAVRYHYDPAQGRYLREQDGLPHADADGRQIAPRSILVAFVRWMDLWVNGAPSSRIDLVGGGRLVILTGGRLREGTWTRPARGPLAFADETGATVVLPPGPVWIELFPLDRPFAAAPVR
ncbi:MAG: DUF3048 domain-containing protein [Armatimonadota bacterium]|nr:DUF3048 domain-containing protein [Armatimonadota bacterium]